MGLFQRSSHRSQYPTTTGSVRTGTTSTTRNPQFHDYEQENRKPASASVASSKKRGLLGGLIRGRTPERERHPLPPPSLTGAAPLSEAFSPPQIQNVPLPIPGRSSNATTNVKYDPGLRQKLREAQKVEAFLSQANTFKPTVGGSDIEFLFNHIATPTAAPPGEGPADPGPATNQRQQGSNIKELREGRKRGGEHQHKRKGYHDHGGEANQSNDDTRENMSKSSHAQQTIPISAPNNPQIPFHTQQIQQKQLHRKSKTRRTTRTKNTDTDVQSHDVQSHSYSNYGGSHNPQHQTMMHPQYRSNSAQHLNNNNPQQQVVHQNPQHILGGPQLQSWADNNQDSYSLDNSSKRSGRGKSAKGKKKSTKRGLFNSRPDLGAFESEDTYYEAMKTLEEGRQFQNVSNAFIQHFSNQDNNHRKKSKPSDMMRSRSAPRERQRRFEEEISSPPQAKTTDDMISHRSMATGHRSFASSQKSAKSGFKPGSVASNNNSTVATPLKGILRNGKYGASASVKSSNFATQDDEKVEAEPITTEEEKSEGGGGGYDVYTSNSGEEMFIGIRPSSSSESSGLYTDEHELIELRACLDSPNANKDGKAAASGEARASEEPKERLDHPHRNASPPNHTTSSAQKGSRQSTQDIRRSEGTSDRQGEPLAPTEKVTQGGEVALQKSTSENSDGLKYIQDRFADMLNSVGDFHEKQNQKIEEMKKSFISTLSATPKPNDETRNSANTKTEGGTISAVRNEAEGGVATQPIASTATASVDHTVEAEPEATDRHDELYRQVMNADAKAVETAAVNLIKERSITSGNVLDRGNVSNLVKERSTRSERASFRDRSTHSERSSVYAKSTNEKSAISEPSHESARAAKQVKERSTNSAQQSERLTVAQTIGIFQSKKVFQRAETQNLMSEPQFRNEAASKVKNPQRQNVKPLQGKLVDERFHEEDDPSLAQVMDLNPSSSSAEIRENLRQYWESQSGNAKQVGNDREDKSASSAQNGRMGLILPQPKGNAEEPRRRNDMELGPGVHVESHRRSTDKESSNQHPQLGMGSSLDNKDGAMDGVVFSIESEDDSHLREDVLATKSQAGGVARAIYDEPIPSAKSSFSMARSRQLSLADSALSEDDTVSSVTTDLLNNDAETHQKGEEKFASLLGRLNSIEERNKPRSERQEGSVDQTVADEISEIKSMLEGLKAQTSRRINQQDPPPDDLKIRRDAPEKRDAPGRNEPDGLGQNYSSGSSTASSGFVKRTLALDAEGSKNITPRKPVTAHPRIADTTNKISGEKQSWPHSKKSGHGSRESQSAHNTSRFSHEKNNQHQFEAARHNQEGSTQWPQTSGHGSLQASRVEHTQSESDRNRGAHGHGSQIGSGIGNYSLHGAKTFSVASGVEQLGSRYGGAEEAHSSPFGSHSAYNSAAVGPTGHGSQVGSYAQHIGPHSATYTPHEMQQQTYPGTYSPHRSHHGYADTRQRFQPHTAGSAYSPRRPLHRHSAALTPHQPTPEELYYSRTESDLTTSVILEEGHTREREVNVARQHKSNRAATYFDTLSVGVKAVGSFDSVSDRYSASTNSKKSRGNSKDSGDSHTKTLRSDSGTLDTISASRSPASKDDDTRSTLPSTKQGIQSRIFRNAKSHIEKMGKKGDISAPFQARVLRVMDPLVGKSSSDDESTLQDEATIQEKPSPKKGYLPACHFFCG